MTSDHPAYLHEFEPQESYIVTSDCGKCGGARNSIAHEQPIATFTDEAQDEKKNMTDDRIEKYAEQLKYIVTYAQGANFGYFEVLADSKLHAVQLYGHLKERNDGAVAVSVEQLHDGFPPPTSEAHWRELLRDPQFEAAAIAAELRFRGRK